MIYRLAYQSRAARPLSSNIIDAIAASSIAWNRANGVTGLLLCDGHRFMQAIEGAEAAILRCMARILEDSRHRDVVVMRQAPVDHREFGGWSLNCRRLARADARQTDFVDSVKSDTIDVADAKLRAMFIGFALLGSG